MANVSKKSDKIKGLHDGHRDRMREIFLKNGFESMHEHQILEMILFYGIPRKDTNDTAHLLLNRFGSLVNVFEAPLDSLIDFGLSKNTAIYIKMMLAFCRKYFDDKTKKPTVSLQLEDIKRRAIPQFLGLGHERVIALFLDAKGREVGLDVVSNGSLTASEVPMRKILGLSVEHGARGVILAHNHPSGFLLPSETDIEVTKKLVKLLQTVNVRLFDHLIVSDAECLSMANVDLFEKLFL